jgi:hypothetical protein
MVFGRRGHDSELYDGLVDDLRGDILTVVAPASPDATLANLAWTFVGSH